MTEVEWGEVWDGGWGKSRGLGGELEMAGVWGSCDNGGRDREGLKEEGERERGNRILGPYQ